MNLALFDFDGTITTSDTFTLFLKYSISPKVKIIGIFKLLPCILGYKLGWIKENVIRTQLCQVAYMNRDVEEIQVLGRKFAQNILPHYIRENAIERILWHKSRGDKIVVVSSSLNLYLSEWCQQYQLDLICNQLDVQNNKCTGLLVDGDCGYIAKVIRIKKKYNLTDFQAIYAYGDTENDKAMLALADKKYYRWKEI